MVTDIDKLIERAKSKLLKGKLDEAESIVNNLLLTEEVHCHKEIDELFQQCVELRQSMSRDSDTTEHEDQERPQTPYDETINASVSNNNADETKIEIEEVTQYVHEDFVVYDLKNKGSEAEDLETFDPEIRMKQNFLKIRSTVLLIGTSIWINNVNIKIPYSKLEKIKLEIEYLIDESAQFFYSGEFEKAYNAMSKAEEWYNHVMPKRQPKKSNPSEKKSQPSVDDGSTIVRHKITVKGDEIDVRKRLNLAKAAITAGNFDKAERMINKANNIMLTTKAAELMNELAEARAAAKKKTEKPEPEAEASKPSEQKSNTKVNNKEAVSCVELAQKAYSERKYIDAREYILKATCIDPDIDVSEFQQDVMTILSYQSKVALSTADEAIKKNDLFTAEKHFKHALKLNFTEDINEKLKRVSAEIKHRRSTALHFMGLAEEAKKVENYYEAEDFLKQAAKADPTIDVSADLIDIQAIISHRKSQATGYVAAADEAIKDKYFSNAEKCLLHAEKLDPRFDVKNKLSYVRAELASRSSSSGAHDTVSHGGGKASKQEKHCKQYNYKPYENPNILKRKVEDLINQADEAILNKELDIADELVKKANSMYYLERSQLLTDRIEASRRLGTYIIKGSTNTESPRGNDQDMIQKTLVKAKEARDKGNLKRAERLYEKAFRMDPCDTTFAELQKIQNENIENFKPSSEQTHVYTTVQISQNIIDAQKYTDRAKKALEGNKYEQAINFLTESLRICPTDEAKDLMDQINDVKDVADIDGRVTDDDSDNETTSNKNNESTTNESSESTSKENNESSESTSKENNESSESTSKDNNESTTNESSESTSKDNNESATKKLSNALAVRDYIGFALDDIEHKYFYAADSWLTLANGTHITPTATQLLETVKSDLKKENLKKPGVQDYNKKLQAKNYLQLAEASLIKDEYDTARLYVVIAQNITNMPGQASYLMFRIFVQQYSKENNVPSTQFIGQKKYKAGNIKIINNFKIFTADRYYKCAEIALKMGNGALAQEYIEKCCKYNKTVDSLKLLSEIRTLNKKMNRLEQFWEFCKKIV